jgi:hypothetical protein
MFRQATSQDVLSRTVPTFANAVQSLNHFKQGTDEDDETTGSESETETTGSESDKAPALPFSQRAGYDTRAAAMDQWRRTMTASWLPTPGRHATAVESQPVGAGAPGVRQPRQHTKTRRVTSVLMIDSLDRDQTIYPLPTSLRLKLPRVYKNVERVAVVQVRMLNGIYPFSASRGNTTFYVTQGGVTTAYTIPDGSYSTTMLTAALNIALNSSPPLPPANITPEFVAATGQFKFTSMTPFSFAFDTTLPTAMSGRQSDWGLGWNLGFGGIPATYNATLVGPVYVLTAPVFPRIYDDYMFLQLNETEHMNMVDHTSQEIVAKSQDSTGQVAHYFGKLLMNNFGCYSQTMVELPKEFLPVIPRLERLNVDWLDRYGDALTVGEGAASCDWHMSLRITEIVEVPKATAALQGVDDSSSSSDEAESRRH